MINFLLAGTERRDILVEGWLLAEPGRIADINNITDAERAESETQTSDEVKAALLISGAEKRRYEGLKNEQGNNDLLGTDQYPDTTEKARVILGNYKPPHQQKRHQPRYDGGFAFIQRVRRELSRTRARRQRGAQWRYRQGQHNHCLNHQRRRESYTFQSQWR